MKKKYLFLTAGVGTIIVLFILVLGTFNKREVTQVDTKVFGNIHADKNGTVCYLTEDNGKVSAKIQKQKTISELASFSEVLEIRYVAWSPDCSTFALNFEQEYEEEGDGNSNYFVVYRDGKIVYESQERWYSFSFLDTSSLVLYALDTESGSGYFSSFKLEENAPVKLLDYNSDGIILKNKEEDGVLFIEQSPNENWVADEVKKLSLTKKRITTFSKVKDLIDFEFKQKSLITTRYENGKYNVYLGTRLGEDGRLISAGNTGNRIDMFNETIVGFESKEGSYNPGVERIETSKDVFYRFSARKKKLFENELLINSISPKMISEREMYFVSNGNLFFVKNPLR